MGRGRGREEGRWGCKERKGIHDRAHERRPNLGVGPTVFEGHGQRSLITGYTEAKQTYTPLASLAERVHGKQMGKKCSFDTPCNNLRMKYLLISHNLQENRYSISCTCCLLLTSRFFLEKENGNIRDTRIRDWEFRCSMIAFIIVIESELNFQWSFPSYM